MLGFRWLSLAEVASALGQASSSDEQPGAGLFGALQRALDGGKLARKVAQAGIGHRLGKVDARIRILRRGGASKLRDGGERVAMPSHRALRPGEPQSILDVVGEEPPEGAIHVDGLFRVALRL